MPGLALPLLAIVAVVAVWWVTRARALFRISVKRGRVATARGRIPSGLLSDIAELVSRPAVKRATIVAVIGEHGATIRSSGIDEGRAQRLRNIFALYPVSRLRRR